MEEKFTDAIFFDNGQQNIANIQQFCDRITCVKIQNGTERAISFHQEPLQSFLNSIPANAYVQFMRKNGIKKDKYDFASGIQEREMHVFVSWLQSYHGKRAAFFDWDRTITMVSGLFLPETTINGEFIEDLLVYALGGFQRLAALRDMFQLCFLNNVTIVILSNSTVCNYANFNAILHQLIKGPFIKLCANGQNKGNVLAKNARFYNLCKTLRG